MSIKEEVEDDFPDDNEELPYTNNTTDRIRRTICDQCSCCMIPYSYNKKRLYYIENGYKWIMLQ